MSDTTRHNYAGRDYVENNRQPEHLGGTGPSWKDAYAPPTCPECGSRLVGECLASPSFYFCMDCGSEYTAEEVE